MFVIGNLSNCIFDKSFCCSVDKPKYYFNCKSIKDTLTYEVNIINDIDYEFDEKTHSMKINPSNEENKLDISNIIFNPEEIKYLMIDKNFREFTIKYLYDEEYNEEDDNKKEYNDEIDILEKIKEFKNLEFIFIHNVEKINLSKLSYFKNLKTLCFENVNYSYLPLNLNIQKLSLSNCKNIKELPIDYYNLEVLDFYGYTIIKEIPNTYTNLKLLNLIIQNDTNIILPDTLINLEEINFIKDKETLKETFIKMMNYIKPTFKNLKIINSYNCDCNDIDFKQNINILYPIKDISNNCIINIYNCNQTYNKISETDRLYYDEEKNISFYYLNTFKNILMNEAGDCIIC